MEKETMIPASEFCLHHQLELSFVHYVKESGLIDVVTIEETTFIPVSQLTQLEKLMRLHQELDINMEGIETIAYLLQRIRGMQEQIVQLNNRLAFYESE